ncbi:MAG: hypothetical protein K9N23_12105 [Akkermansiaceae bacterium]|nr:hypothetical protein [Akkermansiaceae bacterium]
MKTPPLVITRAIISIGLLATSTANAAFIIEANNLPGRRGEGNFAYTGASGTAASYSTASPGQLPATTDTPTPTFFTLGHAYGGNGAADEYTFTYSPATDSDNQSFAAGTLYNSLGASPDLTSTGLTGGAAGTYNVYRIHPSAPNVSGGNTTYQVSVNSTLVLTEIIDQNAADISTGRNMGRWEMIGSVDLLNASDSVSVTMTPDTSSFVSMRASGIMFEYAAQIPEASSTVLLGLAAGLLLRRRRG